MRKVIIHSAPRSGSTWLGNIFNSHPKVLFKMQPLFSYAFKDYLNTTSTKEEVENFFHEISLSDDDYLNQKSNIERGFVPSFLDKAAVTHICYKEVRYHHILENLLSKCQDIKVLLLIRNPLSVLNSWKNSPREFRVDKGWIFEDEWLNAPNKNESRIEEYFGYNKWKESSLLFLQLSKKFPDNVRIIQYANLLNNPQEIISEVFKFVDLKDNAQTNKFVQLSRSTNSIETYSVFKTKTKDDDWKSLPPFIIDYVKNDLKKTELEIFLDE